MTVRQAAPDDIATIRSIALAAWPIAYGSILSAEQMAYMLDRMYGEAALREQMTVRGHRFLLAGTAEAITGFASYSMGHGGHKLTRLHKLYLLPAHKGTGAGRVLLEAIVRAATEAGDAILQLNVNRFNPSIGFYERCGFTVVREEVIDIGQGYVMDDFVMERPLAGRASGSALLSEP